MKTTMKSTNKSADYSWCYIATPANSREKAKKIVSYYCTMCDEHYVNCPQDCMIDYD